ncbi:ABC transporter ATP-binding protein [Glaciimonas immobilis]|uniref:Putative spermidine/putrescine transport system ATP-binding protein n=1 Tax=Glaciimonas immobilis TaxID=728004 RepID=A0A840RV41_9BURK|nr:ABC transporter ATP-binding protein [Glaciimonas immobilis]MBB5201042.1 putative spermidine/putrescine transport system ATP-binding protein [Glaciimonas immobilis]
MKNAVSIQLIQCGKTFANGAQALQPIELAIRPGETVVLLGPSGCGKTTTLRLIAGLEFPDAGGQVLFDGEDVTGLPIEKRGVGMVFQNYALFPNMTVGENIAYGLKIRKIPAAQRLKKIDALLEMVHLQGLGQRRIDQLSGGQKQRVALARALAVEPRVLLLDEPLTALDAKLRETLRADLNQLLRTLGITTIYVTHDQSEAMALGDRVVVMERGKIAQIGTPQDIYYRPVSHFVADFIGTMNRVTGVAGGGQVRFSGGQLPYAVSAAGSQATLMFRPEDVEVVADGMGTANMHGEILSTFFLGDRTRLHVNVGAGQAVVVDTGRSASWQVGQRIALRVPEHALLHFQDEVAA